MKRELSSPLAILITVVAALGRLVPHPANMTPLGASSLFGGAKLGRPWNYLLPIAVLYVTDLFLGFHVTMAYVYGSMLLSVFLAERFLRRSQSLPRVATLAATNSILFFLITNFGVWASTSMYPPTGAGLLQSYIMGLPFLRNMFVGDLIFSVGFFGLYALTSNTQLQQRFDKAVWRRLDWASNN